VTMVSWPSCSSWCMRRVLALLRSTSRRSSLFARAANSLTLWKELRSRGHTWMAVLLRSALAAAPLAALRHARMTVAALRRTRWRAASRPRPGFVVISLGACVAGAREGCACLCLRL
jgi:hypothetical protein